VDTCARYSVTKYPPSSGNPARHPLPPGRYVVGTREMPLLPDMWRAAQPTPHHEAEVLHNLRVGFIKYLGMSWRGSARHARSDSCPAARRPCGQWPCVKEIGDLRYSDEPAKRNAHRDVHHKIAPRRPLRQRNWDLRHLPGGAAGITRDTKGPRGPFVSRVCGQGQVGGVPSLRPAPHHAAESRGTQCGGARTRSG